MCGTSGSAWMPSPGTSSCACPSRACSPVGPKSGAWFRYTQSRGKVLWEGLRRSQQEEEEEDGPDGCVTGMTIVKRHSGLFLVHSGG